MVLKLIKKLLNKKAMMAETEQKKQEVYFVWAKTERAGNIVQPLDVQPDSKWVEFTDGTRCNAALINEMLLRTKSRAEAERMAKDLGFEQINSLPEPVKAEVKAEVEPISVALVAEQAELNVMMAMLEKMSTKNKACVPIEVNLPSAAVYDLLKDQMDVGEEDLNNQIGLLIESQINNMKLTLKEQILAFITNYYQK